MLRLAMYTTARAARRGLAAVLLALAGACAQLPQLPAVPAAPRPEVSVGGALADRDAATGNWLDSSMRVDGLGGLVRYDAQYQLQGGDLLPQLTEADASPLTAAPSRLGGNLLRQSLETRLPAVVGDAPRLSLTSAAGTQWNASGEEALRRDQKAQLAWNPEALAVQLQWTAPRLAPDPAAPLDCSVGGSLKFDLGLLGAADQSLVVGARGCDVDAPDRSVAGIGVDSLSTAWNFGEPGKRQKVSLTRLATTPEAETGLGPASAGYEFKLAQTRTSGRWTGDSALGLRRIDELQGSADTDWTAQANIQRRVHHVGITAGWQRAADPLWFVPGVARPVDRLSLGLDLKSYLARVWSVPDLVNARLSYRWNETSDPALDGGEIYWNLSKSW